MSRTWIRNADWVVAWDAESARHVYRRHADVVFADGDLEWVGKDYRGAADEVDEVVDGAHLMVMPGLVNAHSHPAGELCYRGVREEHGVPDHWMSGLYERMNAFSLDDEGRRACAQASFAEMLAGGVTTVVDVSEPYEGWLDLLADSGLRGYAAASFACAQHVVRRRHEVDYRWDEAAGRRDFEACCAVLDAAEAHPSKRLGAVVSPSTLDNVSADLLRESHALAQATGRSLTVHAAESVVEFHNMVRREGLTPVQFADRLGLLGPRTLLGHAVFLDEHSWTRWHTREDLDRIGRAGASVAHCPTPFSRYGHLLEHFGRYEGAGVNMCLGTDTLPCNLVEEMRTATVLGRIAARHVEATSLASVFRAATVGGARGLGREDIGRLAPGAKADLVVVDLAHPQMRPLRDPLRSLVFSAADRAIRDVYVDGHKVVDAGRVLSVDRHAALERLERAQAAMLEAAPERDPAGRRADEIAPLTLAVEE